MTGRFVAVIRMDYLGLRILTFERCYFFQLSADADMLREDLYDANVRLRYS